MPNKNFVKAAKAFYNQSRHLVDGTYAAIGIAMTELGYEQDDVIEIFSKSQEIWDSHEGNVTGMVKRCEELTGICLIGVSK